MICEKCGKRLSSASAFCSFCGAAQGQPPTVNQKPNWRNTKAEIIPKIIITLGSAFLILLGAFYLLGSLNQPSSSNGKPLATQVAAPTNESNTSQSDGGLEAFKEAIAANGVTVFRLSAVKTANVITSNTMGDFSQSVPQLSGSNNSGNAGLFRQMTTNLVLWVKNGQVILDDSELTPVEITNEADQVILHAQRSNGSAFHEWTIKILRDRVEGSGQTSSVAMANHVGTGSGLSGDFTAKLTKTTDPSDWPPAPITNLTAKLNDGSVSLAWERATEFNNATTTFTIYRTINIEDEVLVGTTTATEFTDSSPELAERISPYAASFATYMIIPFSGKKREGNPGFVSVYLDPTGY